MSKLCIKLRKPNGSGQILDFVSNEDRNEWLRSNGFYESSGIYRHLNGSTAGLFTFNLGQKRIAMTCDKPIKSKSMWSGLWQR